MRKFEETPVLSSRRENSNLYYIVNIEGKEYVVKAFKCQMSKPIPNKVECLVEDTENGILVKQSNRPLIKELYKEGMEATLTVLSVSLDANQNKFYFIEDKNGFILRLYEKNDVDFYSRQKITCLVTGFTSNNLPIFKYKSSDKNKADEVFNIDYLKEQITSISIEQWNNLIETAEQEKSKCEIANQFCLQKKIDDNDFAITCCEYLREINSRTDNLDMLNFLKTLSAYLLEDSNFLDTVDSEEKSLYCQRLKKYLRHSEFCLQAINMEKTGEDKEYVENTLRKLDVSGYLLNYEDRITLMEEIFKRNKVLFRDNIAKLVQVAKRKWDSEENSINDVSLMSPMLENYLRMCPDDIRQNIAILGSQILRKKGDKSDIRLERAKLIRYLALMENREFRGLFVLALKSIVSVGWKSLWFNASDIEQGQHYLLLQKTKTHEYCLEESTEEYIYERKNIVRMVSGNVDLLPRTAHYKGKLRQVMPDGIMPANRFRLFVNESISFPIGSVNVIKNLNEWWRKVELELFDDSEIHLNERPIQNIPSLSVGDKVNIEIYGSYNQESMHCKVCDKLYKGSGFIRLNEIVHYTVHPDSDTFFDFENNRRMQFRAKVKSIVDGVIEFTMKELIGMYLYENRYDILQEEDCYDVCMIKACSGKYCTVSNNGYSVFAPIEGDYKVGDYVNIKLEEITNEGKVNGRIIDYADSVENGYTFQIDALKYLLHQYKNSEYIERQSEEEDDDDDDSQYNVLDIDLIEEFIDILQSMSTKESSYEVQYNYLSYARLLAKSIDDERRVECIWINLKLIEFSSYFVSNGSLAKRDFDNFYLDYKSIIDNEPKLCLLAKQLTIISLLEKDNSEALLEELKNDVELSDLATQVLAYNLLRNSSLTSSLQEIKKSIISIFSNQIIEKPYNFGREDIHTEFKKSAAIPAGGTNVDVDKQMNVLCKVVCGFLNAEGGFLYVGVNDSGVACGLESDLKYFDGKMDKLTNEIRIRIKNKLGADVNGQISDKVVNYGNHEVYQIEIKPYFEPVYMDGVCYQRQGASTIGLDKRSVQLLQYRRSLHHSESVKLNEQVVSNSEVVVESNAKKKGVKLEAPNKNTLKISTSKIRNNVLHDYEENFVYSDFYLKFLDGCHYMVSKEILWDKNCLLELAIHENEKDQYIVCVFDNLSCTRVKISKIKQLAPRQQYVRGNEFNEPLVFVSVAKATDYLLTVSKIEDGSKYARLDKVETFEDKQNLNGRGRKLHNVIVKEICSCEIIDSSIAKQLDRLCTFDESHIGMNVKSAFMEEYRNLLQNKGIYIDL